MNTDWRERFKKGCNSMNISDPPSDHRWILDFIAREKESSRKEGLEEVRKMLAGMRKEENGLYEGLDDNDWKVYNQALTQALQKLQEQIDR